MGSVDAAGVAAGPNALRGSGPNSLPALEGAMTQAGSPDPRNDRICITSSCPRQLACGLPHAASNSFGSLYLSPRTMMAQAIRAILLARGVGPPSPGQATAASRYRACARSG